MTIRRIVPFALCLLPLSLALPGQHLPKVPKIRLGTGNPTPAEGGQPDQPAPNGQPEQPAVGGVGIAFQQDQQGNFVVAQLAPDGPAARAKVPTGAILRAVDQQKVAGLSFEQVRALCVGAIGSTVVLTLETPTEVLDVVLQRAALGQAANGGNGGNRPDAPRGAAIAGFPEVLQPGLRVTYYMGSATLPGTRTQLVPNPDGTWTDPQGRKYSPQDIPSTGGGGFTQYDFVQVAQDCVAANATTFTFADANLQTTTRTSVQAFTGDGNGLGDVWLPPARLQAMVQQGTARRIQYPLDGRTFDAVIDDNRNANGFIRSTYDLATGLLLVYSSATTGAGVATPNGNTSTTGAGATTITSVVLRSVRQVQTPWNGQHLPEWLRQGSQYVYGGSIANSLGEGVVAPWRFASQVAVTRRVGDCALLHIATQLDYGTGAAPQQGQSDRVQGPGSTTPLCIDPQRLRGLQQGQVLDQDPITHWSLTFAGSDGRYAQIVEQGPLDQQSFTYDLQSGMMVATTQVQKQGPATIRTELQLQQQGGR